MKKLTSNDEYQSTTWKSLEKMNVVKVNYADVSSVKIGFRR